MSPELKKFILKFGGVMLIILGILHLAVTPFIARLISENVTEAVAAWLTPPMLLNHIIVGILLLPLGILAFYAANSAVDGESWALVVTRVSAITVAVFPIVLSILMGTRYFGAIPFVVATIIAWIAALSLLAAAFWPNSISRRPRQETEDLTETLNKSQRGRGKS
jgi:hypothetical protein